MLVLNHLPRRFVFFSAKWLLVLHFLQSVLPAYIFAAILAALMFAGHCF
jgi:hypothetical protein